MHQCKYCGSENVEYMGIDEGGDFGEAICDQWHCCDCQNDYEDDCWTEHPDLMTWDDEHLEPNEDPWTDESARQWDNYS